MAGLPVRDPVGDHLLTPQNAAPPLIDYPAAIANAVYHATGTRVGALSITLDKQLR